ncbi:MAG: flagellar biosynthesis repressor FlbT [Rhodobacterales bacterium]|nr:flagellar biosynthesis repressor FlbT [Rhodobacterales bacterium]
MPLKLQIKKGQKIIINGAVLENITAHNVSLLVMNEAAILRDSDILTPEEAVTPASRVYYALQCLYLFPSQHDHHLPHLNDFLESYQRAAPSALPVTSDIRQMVDEGQLYQALKRGRDLILHEKKVLDHVHERLGEELRRTAPGGESEGGGGVGPDPSGAADEGRGGNG